MGKRDPAKTISISNPRLKNITVLIKKILNLKHSERINYIDSIVNKEIDILTEIILNFLNGNIKVDTKSFNLLKRLRTELNIIARKKTPYKIKKQNFKSLKGLNILNILLPFTLKVFENTTS